MSNLISLVPDTFSPLPQRNRPSTATEPVGLYVHALQHGHEKVGERGVVFLVEGDVTSVFETAAGSAEEIGWPDNLHHLKAPDGA